MDITQNYDMGEMGTQHDDPRMDDPALYGSSHGYVTVRGVRDIDDADVECFVIDELDATCAQVQSRIGNFCRVYYASF